MLLLLCLQSADLLAETAAADEAAYPMTRVIEKIQNKMADDDVEDFVEKDVAAAIRTALAAGQERLADGKPYAEAIVGGIDSLDTASFRLLRKNDDLRHLAATKLKWLQFQYPYVHDDRDRAKNRQQQRAIITVRDRLWPPKS